MNTGKLPIATGNAATSAAACQLTEAIRYEVKEYIMQTSEVFVVLVSRRTFNNPNVVTHVAGVFERYADAQALVDQYVAAFAGTRSETFLEPHIEVMLPNIHIYPFKDKPKSRYESFSDKGDW